MAQPFFGLLVVSRPDLNTVFGVVAVYGRLTQPVQDLVELGTLESDVGENDISEVDGRPMRLPQVDPPRTAAP